MAPGQTHILNPAPASAGAPSFGDAPTPAFGIHVSLPAGSHKPYVRQEAAYTPGVPVGKHAIFRAWSVEASATMRRRQQALGLHLDAYLSARTAYAAKRLAHPHLDLSALADEVRTAHRRLTSAIQAHASDAYAFDEQAQDQLTEALS